MTRKKSETRSFDEDVRQQNLDPVKKVTQTVQPEQDSGTNVAAAEQEYLRGAGRTTRENMRVKKEMALAMLKMGVSKKQVMEILNIRIKD